MTDRHEPHHELDDAAIEAAYAYRRAPEVPRDLLWSRLQEARRTSPVAAGEARRAPRARAWWTARRAAAATGFVLLGAGGATTVELLSARYGWFGRGQLSSTPDLRRYLASSDSLIALFRLTGTARVPTELGPWARQLLARTRAMEQSPARTDSTLRQLLGDLDLVLVQIAQYAERPASNTMEVELIDDAIRARRLTAQLRGVLARPVSQPGS